jgi:hypothetical protein
VWPVFTYVHGPTSYNLERAVLGGSMFFWGMLLGGPPNLLVAVGLGMLYRPLAVCPNPQGRMGYMLALIGLAVPALTDLAVGALGAPFFIPVLGAGLLLLARGHWDNPQFSKQDIYILLALGILLIIAFGIALIPIETSDAVGGYRIYGVLAHLLPGIGWLVLGIRWSRADGSAAHV